MSRFTVLLEPTAACNLRCRHCYHSKTEYDAHKMSLNTLERFLSICAPYYDCIKLIWHGGEPLLMGYDFFAEAYSLFDYYMRKHNVKFNFGIQTNGTLLDENIIDLFVQHNTHISLSYDGPYNHILRQETGKVERVIKMLKSKKIDFSCLSTISAKSVEYIIHLYKYFKNLKVSAKFNPIFPDGAARSNTAFIMTASQWANNFIKLFETWFFDLDCNIQLSSCSEILAKYLGGYNSGCINGTCMFRFLAIDSYGNLYPCGRLVGNEFKLTTINEISDIRQTFLSDKYIEILDQNKRRIEHCKCCKWFNRCHAGCNASASLNGDMTQPFEFECSFTRIVFGYLEKLLSNLNLSRINKYAADIILTCK